MGMIYNNPIQTATYKILFNYTGNAFNATNATNSYETAVIAPSDMLNANYVIIHATVACSSQLTNNGGTTHAASLTIQTREQGGAYATDLSVTPCSENTNANSVNTGVTTVQTVSVCHALTAGEKLNGLQVKFIGTSPDASCSIGNSNVFAYSLS